MKKRRDDLPPWACLIGFLPALVAFVLDLGFAVSFLVYIGVTTAMIIVWLLDNILRELRRRNQEAGHAAVGDE